MWLSLVERLIWVQDAAGSNPVIPTSQRWLFACLFDNQKGYISNKYIRDEKPSTQGGNALQPYANIAQLAEHETFNFVVEGSSLSIRTSSSTR